MKRFGSSPKTGVQYSHRPGAYCIAVNAGGVLLTHQAAPEPEFQLPGGGIDPGEHPIHALHREVAEETGWRIDKPRRLGAFRRFVFMPEYDLYAEKICHIYTAHAVRQLHEPIEADHTSLLVPPEHAVLMVENTGDAHFLRHVFAV